MQIEFIDDWLQYPPEIINAEVMLVDGRLRAWVPVKLVARDPGYGRRRWRIDLDGDIHVVSEIKLRMRPTMPGLAEQVLLERRERLAPQDAL